MILFTSSGIGKLTRLETFLGDEARLHRGWGNAHATAVVGWGRKASAIKARKLASKLRRPYWALEDGFLRSLEAGGPPLSLVIDDLGIYYDATQASRLEVLINAGVDHVQSSRAESLRAAWCKASISKYNHMRDLAAMPQSPYVLVADQTRGDASVEYGMADTGSFERMLNAALEDNPECMILLKIHPDVAAGCKQGYFNQAQLAHHARILIIKDAHPAALIANAKAVYVVTSQIGFEALLHEKPVHVFGMPFYAGWGLTRDALPAPDRRRPATLNGLIHASLVDYPRYVDPESGERCQAERIIEWLAWQRSQMQRFPEKLWAINFSGWKRPVVEDFFRGSKVNFVRSIDAIPMSDAVVVWGAHEAPPRCRVIRLEDGFLRSVGLGRDLIRPLSWVLDERGIYYDVRQPSTLEHLLNTTEIDAALLERAARLRQRIVEAKLCKYNLGGAWQRPAAASHVVLVAGQVESDASLAQGSGLKRNIDLLRRVRSEFPDAYIVYKPHPDVTANLRRAGKGEELASEWCDEVVTTASMAALLSQVDAVHVMTSLSGFEALLRDVPVVTYGQPFYAGWGLTQDHFPPSRQKTDLSLDALVAASLILYPSYVSRQTRCFTTPERAVEELLAWRSNAPKKTTLHTRLKRMVLRRVVGVR